MVSDVLDTTEFLARAHAMCVQADVDRETLARMAGERDRAEAGCKAANRFATTRMASESGDAWWDMLTALAAWGKREKAPAAPNPLDALLEAGRHPLPSGTSAQVVWALRECANQARVHGFPVAADQGNAVADFLAAHIEGKGKPAPEPMPPEPMPPEPTAHVCAACKYQACETDEEPCNECAVRVEDCWEPLPPAPAAPKCAKCGIPLPTHENPAGLCAGCFVKAAEAARVEALRRDLKPGMCVQHKSGRQAIVIELDGEPSIRDDDVAVQTAHTDLWWPLSDIAGILTLKGEGDGE